MNSLEIKANIIQLVESTQNEKVLSAVLSFLKKLVSQKGGSAWESLTDQEKDEVLNAFLESEDEENLIPIQMAFENLK
jgi:hypothetical protein